MIIGIIARIKNGTLMQFREKRGLTQRQAADIAGVTVADWNGAECLRFAHVSLDRLRSIAVCVEAELEDICPKELQSKNLNYERTMYRDVQANLLAAYDTTTRLILPSPADQAEQSEAETLWRQTLARLIGELSCREREVLKMRYGWDDGDTHTLSECAKVFKVSRERVRQIEAGAIQRLHKLATAKPEIREKFIDE